MEIFMQTEKHAAANQKPQNFLLAPENLTPTWFQCDGCHSHPSICLFRCRHYYFLNLPSSFMFFMSHTLTNNIVTNTLPMAGTGIFRDFSLCQLQRNVSLSNVSFLILLNIFFFLPYMTLCSFSLYCIYPDSEVTYAYSSLINNVWPTCFFKISLICSYRLHLFDQNTVKTVILGNIYQIYNNWYLF